MSATTRDPKLSDVLRKINDAGEHPFTSFINEYQFEPVHALDVLCERALKEGGDWTKCSPPDLKNDMRFRQLKGGQIILLAENSQRDHFESVLGEVPGYVLQANYIESLLDNRCFRPLSPWWELLLSAIGVVLIIVTFETARKAIIGLLLAYLLVFVIAVICNVIEVYLGWFVGFWLSLVPITFLEWVFTLKMKAASKNSLKKSGERSACP